MANLLSSDMTSKASIEAMGTITYSGMPTHNGTANASTLSDTTRSFATNALVDATIYNLTDGSSGTITANSATTVTATLSGGTDNDWDVGDTYLICHPENGTFFSNNMEIKVTSIPSLPAITEFSMGLEIEQEALSCDQSDYASDFVQSSSAQAARALSQGYILYTEEFYNTDRRYIGIRPDSASVYTLECRDNGTVTSVTGILCSKAVERAYTSTTGVEFCKAVLSANHTESKLYVNRMLQMTASAAGDFTNTIFTTVKIGYLNAGIGDYWVRNVYADDAEYVPYLDGNEVSKGHIILAGLGDSFIKKGFESPPPPVNNIAQWGKRIAQEIIKAGYQCDVVDAGHNGHGWAGTVTGPIDSTDVNTMLAQSPTDVIMTPSVNDLSYSGGTATYATGFTSLDHYKSQVRARIEEVAAGPSVKRIYVATQPPFLNAAAAAGYTGTNLVAQAHYNDPSKVAAINAFWMQLKTDSSLSTLAKSKLQPTIQLDTAMGCTSDGKGYSREQSLASATGVPTSFYTDIHQSQLGMIAYAAIFAPAVINAIQVRRSSLIPSLIGSVVSTG